MILTKIINWFKPTPVELMLTKTEEDLNKIEEEVLILKLKKKYKIVKQGKYFMLKNPYDDYIDLKHGSCITWRKNDLYFKDCRTTNINDIKSIIKKFNLDILL